MLMLTIERFHALEKKEREIVSQSNLKTVTVLPYNNAPKVVLFLMLKL